MLEEKHESFCDDELAQMDCEGAQHLRIIPNEKIVEERVFFTQCMQLRNPHCAHLVKYLPQAFASNKWQELKTLKRFKKDLSHIDPPLTSFGLRYRFGQLYLQAFIITQLFV